MIDETKTDLAAAPVSLPAGGRQDSVPIEETASTRSLCPANGVPGDPAPEPPTASIAPGFLSDETKLGISQAVVQSSALSEKDLTKGAERAQLLLAARPFFGKYSLE